MLNSVVDIDSVSAAGFMLSTSGHIIMAVPTSRWRWSFGAGITTTVAGCTIHGDGMGSCRIGH